MQRRVVSLRGILVKYAMVTLFLCITLIVCLLLFSPILDVRAIKVERLDSRIDAEQIREAVAPFFGQHLLLLVPEQVHNAIQEAIPDADTITITKQYPSTILLHVTPDPIIARLIIENPNAATASGVVVESGALKTGIDFLTNQGTYVSYHQNQVDTGTGVLELHVVDWAVRPEVGKPMVQSGFLLAMQTAETILAKEFNLPVQSRTIFLRAREFHLHVPGYTLWFDMRTPIDEQFARYRIFLQYIGTKSVKEYVDLRIRKMIVYK